MQYTSLARFETLESRTLLSTGTPAMPPGTPDPAFGQGGSAVVSFTQDNYTTPRILLRRPDGSLAVVGDLSNQSGVMGVVASFTAGGTLDSNFANNPLPLLGQLPYAAAVQADGKIIVVTTKQNASLDLFVYRLNVNGTIDNTFNATGQEMIDVGAGTDDFPVGVAIQHNGSIVIAGVLTPAGNQSPSVAKTFVIRLTASGPRDMTFGGGGLFTMPVMPAANPLTIDAQDNILVYGTMQNQSQLPNAAVVRLNQMGQPDGTFNQGMPFITGRAVGEQASALTILPSGKILTAYEEGSSEQFSLLNKDGTPDTTFGSQGTYAFAPTGDQITSLGVDSSGRLIAGFGQNGTAMVARFNPDLITPDTTFGVNGRVTLGQGFAPGEVIVVPADNSIFYSHSTGSDFIVTRLLSDAGSTTPTTDPVNNPPQGNPPDTNPPPKDPGSDNPPATDDPNGIQQPPNNLTNTGLPNIVAMFPGTDSTLTPGSAGHVAVFASNQGSASQSVDANIYLSQDSIAGNADDILIGHLDAVQVAGNVNGMKIGAAPVQIPASVSNGNYYLVEVVDPNNLINESNENDNAAVSSNPFPVGLTGTGSKGGQGQTDSQTGLSIDHVRVTPMNVIAGSAFNFLADVTNDGPNASVDRVYNVYLSAGPMRAANDIFLGTVTFPALQVGASVPFSATLTVPSQTVPASYFISGTPVDPATADGDTGGTTKTPVLNVMAAQVKQGSLNSNFGTGGVAQNKVQAAFTAVDSVLDSTGRLVVAGTQAGSGFVLVRFNSNGTIDSTFGVGGIEQIMIGPDDMASSITIDANGKFLIAGTSQGNFTVLRCNANGSPDMSFGTNGFVVTDLAPLLGAAASRDVAKEIAVRGDGKIYVVGSTDARDAGDFAVVRYNANGTVDGSFGSGGAAAIDFGRSLDTANTITIQQNGFVVVAGSATLNGVVQVAAARLLNNGALDQHFGTAGRISFTGIGNDSEINAIRTQADGKLILGGFYAQGTPDDGSLQTNFYLARLDTTGHLDSRFGSGGQVRTTVPNIALSAINDLVVTPEGKIIVAGKTAATLADAAAGNVGVALARYTSTGQIDTTFNSTGFLLLFQPTSTPASAALPRTAGASNSLTSAFSTFSAAAAGLVNLTPGGGILALATTTDLSSASSDSGDSSDSSSSSSSGGTTTVSIASIVADGADLVSSLSATTIPSAVITGAKGQVTLTVKNSGTVAIKGSVPLTLYLSTSSIHTSGDRSLISTKLAVDLAAGKSKKFIVSFTFPKSITDGDYFIVADLNASGTISELSTTNDDSSSSTTTNVAKPYVNVKVAYTKTPTGTITPGKVTPVTLTITDTGNLAATGTITGKLVASSDDVFDSSDKSLLPFTAKVNLQPGKSMKVALKLKLTSGMMPPGTAFLAAVLKYAGKQKDSNSTDNSVFSDTELTFT